FENGARDLTCASREGRRNERRCGGDVEDLIAVTVFERRILGDGSVEPARGDDRDLRLQRDEPLAQDLAALQRGPHTLGVGGFRDLVLSLAVVANRGRLDHRRHTDPCHSVLQLGQRRGPREWYRRKSAFRQKRLLAPAVLCWIERITRS